MSQVEWFQPPYLPDPSSDARRRLRNPVPIHFFPRRYRSEVALPTVGLIRFVGNEWRADTAPVNLAQTPEELARMLSTDPSTALASLSMDSRHFDLLNGTADVDEQRELTVCLFATVQVEQRNLLYFRDATLRYHGRDMGWGTVSDLLREYGHDIRC